MKNNFQSLIFSALLGCALCAVATGAAAETTNSAPGKQALFFRNGDILIGNLESIRSDKTVVWRRNDVSQPMEFSGTNLLEVQFPRAKQETLSATNACRVELRNGDSFEGKLLQLDSEKIVLQTSFAGKLTFPRRAVEMLEPMPPQKEPIYSGPTGLEGWTMGKASAFPEDEAGQWQYTNGAFYAIHSASIARDLHLPDVARIEFDLAWKGVLQSAIALYTSYMQPVNLQTKDTNPDFGAFYSLQINSFVSTLMPVRRNEPLKYMGQIPVPAFSQKNHAHLEILANKPKRSIALFVDGSLVKEWVDTEEFAGSGTGMRFVHQGHGAVKLSHLRISEWNGKMESQSTNRPAGDGDIAKLLNGDKVSGTLENYRDGKLSFLTDNGKLAIPFERVSEAYFARKNSQTSPTGPENIRAFFSDGGSVTFRVQQWDSHGVVAESPNFGRATFAPEAFERAQLNPALFNSGQRETPEQNEPDER